MRLCTNQTARFLVLCSAIAAAGSGAVRIEDGLHFDDGDFLPSGNGIAVTTLPDQYYTKALYLNEAGTVLHEWEFTDMIGHAVHTFGDSSGRIRGFLLSGRTTAGVEPERRMYLLKSGEPELIWDTAIFEKEYDGAVFSVSNDGETWAASWCLPDWGRVVVGEIGSYRASQEWYIESENVDDSRPLDTESTGVVFLQSELDSVELLAQCEGRLTILRRGEEPKSVPLPDDVRDLGSLAYQPDTGFLWGNQGYPDGWLGFQIEDHRKQPNRKLAVVRINGAELGIGPILELRHFLPGGRLVALVQGDREHEASSDAIYYLNVTPKRITAKLVQSVPRQARLLGGGVLMEPLGDTPDKIEPTAISIRRLEQSPSNEEFGWDLDDDGRPRSPSTSPDR